MTKKILLIDDDKMIIDMYQTSFSLRNGYQLIAVTTLKEGKKIAKEKKPDLILLDLVFPKEEGLLRVQTHAGYKLLKELKKDPQTKDIPVIVLTNLAEGFEDEKHARNLGADDYVVKAKHVPREVIKKIDEMLKK